MGNLLNLVVRDQLRSNKEICFHMVSFWVQVHNVPLDCFVKENVGILSRKIGTLKRWKSWWLLVVS